MLSVWITEHQKEIWSVATILLGAIITRLTRLKPKLRYSFGHGARLVVNEPLVDDDGKQIAERQTVQTRSLTLANWGLQPAKGVEVTTPSGLGLSTCGRPGPTPR